jgi:hypothetical protein
MKGVEEIVGVNRSHSPSTLSDDRCLSIVGRICTSPIVGLRCGAPGLPTRGSFIPTNPEALWSRQRNGLPRASLDRKMRRFTCVHDGHG